MRSLLQYYGVTLLGLFCFKKNIAIRKKMFAFNILLQLKKKKTVKMSVSLYRCDLCLWGGCQFCCSLI